MAFEPRVPLVAAERFVDYDRLNDEIIRRRASIERATVPIARRLVQSLIQFGSPSRAMQERLVARLARELDRTASLGYREAQAEIAAFREQAKVSASGGSSESSVDPSPKAPRARASERAPGHPRRRGLADRSPDFTAVAYAVPDAGRYGHVAREGLRGVYALTRERAAVAAIAVSGVAVTAYREEMSKLDPEPLRVGTAVLLATTRELHRHVLELVGEALNLGRTAGAMRYPDSRGGPPEFAMRSEQLDKRTCSACEGLHGTITQVGSSDYFSYLPPTGCYGGGRCRAVMVFADGPEDVRGPDTEPGPQPPLPPL